jgi:hypothetical protein
MKDGIIQTTDTIPLPSKWEE